MPKELIILIVGSEQRKWTKKKESVARFIIQILMKKFPDALYISGECPKGGVDIWVKEIAKALDKRYKGYPPEDLGWYWYRKRNLEMAQRADIIVDIEPKGYGSGGTYTMNQAKKLGKLGIFVEI